MDKHSRTVYRDQAFQTLMDSTYGPRWRDWPFRMARRYAKTYNEVKTRSHMTQSKLRAALEGPGLDDSSINDECICGDVFWMRGRWRKDCPQAKDHWKRRNDVNYTPPIRYVKEVA